jgi:hypothetical protein
MPEIVVFLREVRCAIDSPAQGDGDRREEIRSPRRLPPLVLKFILRMWVVLRIELFRVQLKNLGPL